MPTRTATRRQLLQHLGVGAWALAEGCAWAQGAAEPSPGFVVQRLRAQRVAPLAWTDLHGQRWSLGALRGRAVLLNLWASWCAPCREEMPTLQALQSQVGAQRLQVLLFNHREPAARVGAFVAQQGWSLPVVADEPGAMARHWGVRIFPSSVLIDARGREVALVVGAVDWMAQQDAAWMRDWLGPSAPARSAP
ncbi:MAG: TlpA family protein disulfide reductase [Rhodoferax sp.]